MVHQGLSEHDEIKNFNPASIPFVDIGSDSDQNDTCPSEIRGIVYARIDLPLRNRPHFKHALLVAGGDIRLYGDTYLSHSGVFLANPPPGFAGPEEIRVLLNSYQKLPQ